MMGASVAMVITSDRVVKDLLDKRGDIYSSRKETFITQIITGGNEFVFMVRSPFSQAASHVDTTLTHDTEIRPKMAHGPPTSPPAVV